MNRYPHPLKIDYEELLADERHAHGMTKAALRNALADREARPLQLDVEIEALKISHEAAIVALELLLAEAEDVFNCMADATGIDRHNYPEPYRTAAEIVKAHRGKT